jgi:hypothetical protein
VKILPDPDFRHRCRHRGGDPDCSCYPECPECGAIYDPSEGHDCLDDVPADELLELTKEIRDERDNLRRLLRLAAPHVEASAGASHMLDGFRRKVRPLDKLVEEIWAALTTEGAKA